MIDQIQLEKFVLSIIIGVCEALKEKAVGIDEAEYLIFTPYSMKILKNLHLRKEIVNLIHMGTELEDIVEINSNEYNEQLDEIKVLAIKYLKEMSYCDFQKDKWIGFFEDIIKVVDV